MKIDYTDFTIWLLEKLDLKYDYIQRDTKGDYILTQNPLNSDTHASMQVYIDNGFAKSWNSLVDGKSRVHLKEIARQTGYLGEYITFICQQHSISHHNINGFKDLIIKKSLSEYYNYKQFGRYIDMFKPTFLSMSDIIGINETKRIVKDKFKCNPKKKKSSMDEVEQTQVEYNECLKYITDRKLEFIDGIVETCTLKFRSGYRHSFIKLTYPDSFCKYRYCGNGDFRYVSKGLFKKLFEVRVSDNKDIAFVIEGEFESVCFSKCIEDSIYAMHNVNSINDLTQLEKYNKIVIIVDNDKYKEVSEALVSQVKTKYIDKDVICIPKFDSNDKSLDFNNFLINKGQKELQIYLRKRLTNI